MKIGIDARMYSESFGIGRYIFEITKRMFEMTEQGSGPFGKVEWVMFLNQPQFDQYDFSSNVRKVLVDAPFYSFSEQTKFLRVLDKEKCDLVHFTNFNHPILYRGNFVTTIHDTTISFFPGKKFSAIHQWGYNLVIGQAVKKSREIITVSENTKRDVIRLFGGEEEKITPILLAAGDEFGPLDEGGKKRIRKKFNLGKYLLYTGNWREHKNLVGLIKAFSEVRKKFPDYQLVITGKEDPFYPEVLETTKQLGLEDSIVFTGIVDFQDLVSLYGGADLYVFPSFYEGFGLPPLEAMRCEVPVVASGVASIPEVCGEAVEYFDPEDSTDMARVMMSVLGNEKRQQQLIEAGKKRVSAFDWKNTATKTLEIYAKALES